MTDASSVIWQPWHVQIESLLSGSFGNSVEEQFLHLMAPRKDLSSVGSEHLWQEHSKYQFSRKVFRLSLKIFEKNVTFIFVIF